jgi:hypothetical protein
MAAMRSGHAEKSVKTTYAFPCAVETQTTRPNMSNQQHLEDALPTPITGYYQSSPTSPAFIRFNENIASLEPLRRYS